MTDEKFNPIANLPNLPGAEIVDDETETNIIDSTYPPIDGPNKDMIKPKIESVSKTLIENSDTPNQQPSKNTNLFVTRIVISVILIALIFGGILLILQVTPPIVNFFGGATKSISYLFVSNKTNTKIPTTIALVATSTPVNNTSVATDTTKATTTPAVTTQPATSTPVTTTTPNTVARPKTPAKLIAAVMSIDQVGNRTILKFNVQNTGGTPSGPWSFSVNLPSTQTPVYNSVQQASLTQYSGVINTLEFSADQDYPISITLYTQQGTFVY